MAATILELMKQALEAKIARGQEKMLVDEDAILRLRKWFIEANRRSRQKIAEQLGQNVSEQKNLVSNEERKVETSVKLAPESLVIPEGDTSQQLKWLQKQIEVWPKQCGISTLRSAPISGSGAQNPQIIFLGDVPGYYEEEAGSAFSGPTGNKLTAILKAMGLKREDVWLTYLVKYRPMLPNQTTNNRTASIEEIEAFEPIFRAELEILKPKVIVCLGEAVARVLTGNKEVIELLRGKFYETSYGCVRCSYHPSRLLLNENDLFEKRKFWEDMLAVMEKAQLPINERQRGYFL